VTEALKWTIFLARFGSRRTGGFPNWGVCLPNVPSVPMPPLNRKEFPPFVIAFALWRAYAVIAANVVRLQRFAEIERTVADGVGCQWRPDRACQIGASFHHYHLAAGPVDVEPKLIAPHAKAAITGLD
jgi:hypothetical protein